MAKSKRRRLACDFLEGRQLLSVAQPHLQGHAHAMAVRAGEAAAAAVAAAVAQVGTSSTVTGGGLLNVGPAPSTSDTAALQEAASTNNLMSFLSMLEAGAGSSSTTQQTATSIANDARNLDLAMWGLANSLGVNLPPLIMGNDQIPAQQMISAVESGNVDPTFTTIATQVETGMVNQLHQLQASTQNTAISTFITTVLPTVQADLAALQGTGTLTPVSTTPSSTTLNSTDLSDLETSYSMNMTERFLGQLTTLVSPKYRDVLYAQKLVGDHEMVAVQQGMYAAATGTYLPAVPTGSDIQTATTVVGALVQQGPSKAYDSVYFQQMILAHTMDLQANEATLSNTTNPVLTSFAMMGIPTDFMHRLTARSLRQELH